MYKGDMNLWASKGSRFTPLDKSAWDKDRQKPVAQTCPGAFRSRNICYDGMFCQLSVAETNSMIYHIRK